MHFFNDKALAIKLRNNELSSKQELYYLIIGLTIYAFFTCSFWSRDSDDKIDYMLITIDVLTVASGIFGTLFLFKINAKGDGKNFIERYICLSLPITIHCAIFYAINYIVICLIILGIYADDIITATNIDHISTMISYYLFGGIFIAVGYFYVRFYFMLKIASGSHLPAQD